MAREIPEGTGAWNFRDIPRDLRQLREDAGRVFNLTYEIGGVFGLPSWGVG
jgi:hypothetical protein